MIEIDVKKARYLMMKRQNLLERDKDADYEKLFRLMSPVPTLFWTTPGEPPTIEHRTDTDDKSLNNYNRAARTIIKGRFRGGNVGYIYADELPLFMSAYKKEAGNLTRTDEVVLETIRQEGAMNIHMIKEITGLLSKHIAHSLQKMQKAFILFEDQIDNEWDRAWYVQEDEFYDFDFSKYDKAGAIEEVISRFAYLNVFFDETMVKSFAKLTNIDIKNAINSLIKKDILALASAGEKTGYVLKNDLERINECAREIPDDIYILDLNDYIVKSNELELKQRFDSKPYKTLHYILRGGEIVGALTGRFTFGPYELEDVLIDLPTDEMLKTKQRIIEKIEEKYDPHETLLKRYCGETRIH